MKTLRVLGVVVVLLAAAGVTAAPAIRELWPLLRGDSPARVAMVPFALIGHVAATRDIATNDLKLVSWGCGLPSREYGQLLWQRHRVRLIVVGTTWANWHQHPRWLGYNVAMRNEIERRFGTGVLDSALQEAYRLQLEAARARAVRLTRPAR